MNWRRYKLLWGTGVVTLVLTGVGIFFWVKAGNQNQELEAAIQRLETQRSGLTGESPFPSEESVEVLKTEQEKVKELRNELLRVMEEGQITPPRLARTMFADFVRDLVPRLRALAKASTRGGEEGVVLQDPEFGLSNYLRGELPEASRIPSLLLELETMAHLAEILFTRGISELVDIQVVAVEEADQAGLRRRGGRLPGASPRASSRALPDGASEGEKEPDAEEERRERVEREMKRLFEPLVLDLRFKVYEDMFWGVMNALTEDSNQFVVRRLHITNGNGALWPEGVEPAFDAGDRPQARGGEAGGDRNSVEAMLARMQGGEDGAGQEDTATAALPGIRERRSKTAGGELLHVSMRIALYRLNPQALVREEN